MYDYWTPFFARVYHGILRIDLKGIYSERWHEKVFGEYRPKILILLYDLKTQLKLKYFFFAL